MYAPLIHDIMIFCNEEILLFKQTVDNSTKHDGYMDNIRHIARI